MTGIIVTTYNIVIERGIKYVEGGLKSPIGETLTHVGTVEQYGLYSLSKQNGQPKYYIVNTDDLKVYLYKPKWQSGTALAIMYFLQKRVTSQKAQPQLEDTNRGIKLTQQTKVVHDDFERAEITHYDEGDLYITGLRKLNCYKVVGRYKLYTYKSLEGALQYYVSETETGITALYRHASYPGLATDIITYLKNVQNINNQ